MLALAGDIVSAHLHMQRLALAAAMSLYGLKQSLPSIFAEIQKQLHQRNPNGCFRIKLTFKPGSTREIQYTEIDPLTEASQEPTCLFLETSKLPNALRRHSFWKSADYTKRWTAAGGKETLFYCNKQNLLNSTSAAVVWGKMHNQKIISCFSSTPRHGVLASTTLQQMIESKEFSSQLKPIYKVMPVSDISNADYLCLVSSIRGFRPVHTKHQKSSDSFLASKQFMQAWLKTIAKKS